MAVVFTYRAFFLAVLASVLVIWLPLWALGTSPVSSFTSFANPATSTGASQPAAPPKPADDYYTPLGDLGVASTSASAPAPAATATATAKGKAAATTQATSAPTVAAAPPVPDVPHEYIAVCAAIKDQKLDMPEWLKHHHFNMGINRFYIMDDGSNPPLSTFAKDYGVPPEVLTFVYYNASQRVHGMQIHLYDECNRMFGANHTWMAYIDGDEFFDTPGNETMNEILKGLEPLEYIGALGVNWQLHTSNGLLTRPQSVMKAYTECIADTPLESEDFLGFSHNVHIKSIVRSKNYVTGISPHQFHLTDGAITVGEYGDPIVDPKGPFRRYRGITRNRISLHHYGVKSKQEWEEKMQRGNALDDPKKNNYWDYVETRMKHVPCDQMVRWVK